MSNNFRESIKVDPSKLNSNLDKHTIAERNAQNYTVLFNIPEVREYFVHIVSALALAHYYQFRKKHDMPGLKAKFRFKSFNSLYNKSLANLIKYGSISEPISDGFAMTMVTDVLSVVPTITDTPVRYTSEDPHLKELISKKLDDDEFSKKMREFKDRFVEDDSYEPVVFKSKTDVTQEEYYSNCLNVLSRTKVLINPEETSIIAPIEDSISLIESKLDMVRSLQTGNLSIPNSELMDENTSFTSFLRNFEKRKNRELAITLLTREIKLLFQNPQNKDLFDKLGIKFSENKKQKMKRTKDSYEANFVYVDTPFGTIEIQLQTTGQYRDGRTDEIAGHGKYKKNQAKSLKGYPLKETHSPIPTPSPEEMANPEVSKAFLTEIENRSPKRGKLEIAGDKAEVVENGLLDNYRLIFEEIGGSMAEILNSYLANLESRTDSPLNDYPTKNIQYYTQASNENYLVSPNLEKVSRIAELWNSHSEDFAQEYYSSELFNEQPDIVDINAPGQTQLDFSDSFEDR